MDWEILMTIAAFLICFVTAAVGLKTVAGNLTSFVPNYNWRKDTFLPVYVTIFAAFTILFGLNRSVFDMIFPLHWGELLLALSSVGLIYLISVLPKTTRYTFLTLAAATAACTLFLPRDFTLFQNHLPFWADRFLTVLIWIAYAWCFRFMNGIDGIAANQASAVATGLLILSVLGGLPILFGNFSAALLGALSALLMFTWYPAKLLLKEGACVALGFLLGWMIILSAREGTASCALIFSMYFIIEILWAFFRKLLHGGTVTANTTYDLTNSSGLSPAVVGQNIVKLQTVLLVIGSFQVYAPNNYSLPMVSALITLWFLSRLRNWQDSAQSLSEINRDVIRDIKDNVEDIKNIIK